MKQLQHNAEAYMELSVEAHETFQDIKPYIVDYNLLQPVSSEDQKRVISSIEALTNVTASLNKFSKEIVAYASTLQQAALRYIDVLEKQCKLSQESITPLLKSNEVFTAIYGEEVYNNLKNTRVTYFRKNKKNDYPLAIIEQLADVIVKHADDDIKFSCVKLLKCSYKDSQLDYPRINALLNSESGSLEALGHSTEAFHTELQYFAGPSADYGAPSYLKIVQQKQDIVATINSKYTAVAEYVKQIKPESYSKQDIQNAMKKVSDLQCYTVALSSLMFLLQSASYTAYEAGYSVHMAEVNYTP